MAFILTAMEAAIRSLGPYRVADYDALPAYPRHELVYGKLVVMPSPNLLHQAVAVQLLRHLRHCARRTRGWVAIAPADVVLADHSVVQPDLYYVASDRKDMPLHGRREGAPDLVVEVLSPSTSRHDRGVKLDLYASSGVRECWIVDPQARSFDFLVNEGGRFRAASPVEGIFISTVPGIQIEPAEFWRELDEELA